MKTKIYLSVIILLTLFSPSCKKNELAIEEEEEILSPSAKELIYVITSDNKTYSEINHTEKNVQLIIPFKSKPAPLHSIQFQQVFCSF